MPRTKECAARVKAAGPADGLSEGQFTALVSVFGTEDSAGDVVVPGAFTQTLADWAAKGDPIPVIWSHDWGDPFAHVGVVLAAEETPDGLLVTGQIEDIDTNPTAAQVYRLLKGRRVTQFSFAYDVEEGAWVEGTDEEGDWEGWYELRRLKLYEVGPCLVGCNQQTELIAAKAEQLTRGVKAGRVLAQRHIDTLTAAHAAIGDVLAAAQAADGDAKTTTAGESGRRRAEEDAPAAKAAAGTSAPAPAQVLARALTRKHLIGEPA
ncbi:HK97 family phage prohead protease [Kitasatospora cheerisanensis]|uniref:Phage prohead protease n=1 Tax=Kitasatospora cheerisanensis KCTC 2395 TaxID=1348663 RepID=A0A066Z8T5_9ACTN|nr:HK97 family phage prohead protease [Kitasatospora cheerisanensis]KDN86711.1 phage prohead protease [Kitasatospora cheerisanensis KCTC 2395]